MNGLTDICLQLGSDIFGIKVNFLTSVVTNLGLLEGLLKYLILIVRTLPSQDSISSSTWQYLYP